MDLPLVRFTHLVQRYIAHCKMKALKGKVVVFERGYPPFNVQIFKLEVDRHLLIANFYEGSTLLPSLVSKILKKEILVVLGQ